MLNWKEVSIPMPWGNISGKLWGYERGFPVICLHGYNDNAASFDNLLFHFEDESRCFLALDLPGNGKSDHYPTYCRASFLEYLADLKRICLHFSWSNVDIIAHSVRSHLSLYLASVYPELVRKLILIDINIGEVLFEFQHIYDLTAHEVNSLVITRDEPSNHHLYTEEEALKKFIEGRITPLNKDLLLPIFERSIGRYNEKVYFKNDKRNVKFMTPLVTSQFHLALITKVQCQVLILLSNIASIYLEKAKTSYVTLKLLQNCLGKRLTIKQTDFSHEMHIENPAVIASIISDYILDVKPKL